MTTCNRVVICTDIIALLQAATSDNLEELDDEAIEYGLRTLSQMYAVKRPGGIFVGVGEGTLEELTAAVKFDLQQTIYIQVYAKGHNPTDDQKYVINLAEEIEDVILASANIRLTNGGDNMRITRFSPGPPTAQGNLHLHFVEMHLTVQKTVVKL